MEASGWWLEAQMEEPEDQGKGRKPCYDHRDGGRIERKSQREVVMMVIGIGSGCFDGN